MPYFLRLYAVPFGRIGRFAYNFYLIAPAIVTFAVIGFFARSSHAFVTLALFVVLPVVVWASIAMGIKRLHDIGYSGWWLLVLWVVIIGVTRAPIPYAFWVGKALSLVCSILLIAVPGQAETNRYGVKP